MTKFLNSIDLYSQGMGFGVAGAGERLTTATGGFMSILIGSLMGIYLIKEMLTIFSFE